jgi:hypothetical protein
MSRHAKSRDTPRAQCCFSERAYVAEILGTVRADLDALGDDMSEEAGERWARLIEQEITLCELLGESPQPQQEQLTLF